MELIIQLIAGALGGNVAGGLLKNQSLGTLGNSLAGIVGGGLGGQILGSLLGGGGDAAAAASGLDFGSIMVDWDLASGNPLEPGSNYLIANQFEVTTITPIPEPGTWAASLLLLTIGGAYIHPRNARRPAIAQA